MKKLITIKVLAEVSHPKRVREFNITKDGKISYLPGTGSVVLGPQLGDFIKDWVGDHIEPGVSAKSEKDSSEEERALMTYACIGNTVEIVKAKDNAIVGKKGVVFGKHGGINHVLIWFEEKVLERLVPGDELVIYCRGVGLDNANFLFFNIDESFLEWWKLKGFLEETALVPITKKLDDIFLVSGYGHFPFLTDYDLENYPDDLRFGDIVAFKGGWDRDWKFSKEYWSVGVVVHGDSSHINHGVGVNVILSSGKELNFSVISDLNIKNFIEKIYGSESYSEAK
ncbi:MAG: DUF4438 domain-containing protein [Candidatus Micrarchaeia archaeon]